MLSLTEEQEKVVQIHKGVNLVLAPAGSGKTELLAERVIRALDQGHDSSKMACLTFTIRAGKNMIERVDQRYPDNEVLIGNIHSICARFLFDYEQVDSQTQILDDEESRNILEELMREAGMPRDKYIEFLKLATYIERKSKGIAKSYLSLPREDFLSSAPRIELAKRYIEIKRRHAYLDYEDILTQTYCWLRRDKNGFEKLDWIQVDEVQDLNPIQLAIIKALVSEKAVEVYFGDYNQAIYGFMGAHYGSLKKFIQSIKESQGQVYYLTQNFRSPAYLQNLYNDFLTKNLEMDWERLPIASNQSPKGDHDLGIYNCSPQNQYNLIGQGLIPAINRDFAPAGSKEESKETIAILVRDNRVATEIGEKLDSLNKAYFKISGYDLFQRSLVKTLMAYLKILAGKSNSLAWLRLVYGLGIFRSLGEGRYFLDQAKEANYNLDDLLKHGAHYTSLMDFVERAEEKEIVVFDTETTGLDSSQDHIIQIAAVKIKGQTKLDEIDLYLKTDKDLSDSEKVHHISREKLDREGLDPREGLERFLEFCGKDVLLVAHNLNFDFQMLGANFKRSFGLDCQFEELLGGNKNFFDSLAFARQIYPRRPNYRLESLIDYLGLEGTNSHNALDDTRATAELVKRLIIDSRETIDRQEAFIRRQGQTLERIKKRLDLFSAFYHKRKEEVLPLSSLVDHFIEEYEELYAGDKEKSLEVQEVKKEIKKLTRHMDVYSKEEGLEGLTLGQKLGKLLDLYREFNEADLYLGEEKILISTIHKAKGLEFDSVIIPNANLYPNYYFNNIDEDARLFYVAMTRAKKRLYLMNPGELTDLVTGISAHFRQYSAKNWSGRK